MALRGRAAAVLRRSRRIPKAQWVAHWRSRPVERDAVLWEATGGVGLVCQPWALFRAVAAADDLRHLRHVWVVRDRATAERARERLDRLGLAGRVRLVRHRSRAYYRHLATAGQLVNNATFPGELGLRPGQHYLNTWHGTPLKSMGYDTPGGVAATANISRNLLAADHVLSSGPFMTETMYRRAYRLGGIHPGTVLEAGNPRTDVQHLSGRGAREALREDLRAAGVPLEDRRVVLVAPTWRGESFARPDLHVDDLRGVVAALRDGLGPDWQVLVKAHPVVHADAEAVAELAGRLVPPDVPTNEVLAVTDHLVTDYSSVLFDALAGPDLPMTFHVPDREDYVRTRPLYLDPGDLPGTVATTTEEVVADVVDDATPARHADRRARWRERYAPLDDGRAAERVLDVVFRGRVPAPPARAVTGLDTRTGPDGRPVPRVVVHAGALQHNGITASLLALLGALDPARVDVTLAWGVARRADPEAFLAALPPWVRVLPRVGGMNGPKRLVWARRLLEWRGATDPAVPEAALTRLFADEWVRCFGRARFDHVVDFSGYSPFWAFLFSRGVAPAPVATHAIWLHNDLAREAEKTIGGRRTHARNLEAVFSLYRRYDRLVSVSPALAQVNATSLADRADGARFVAARNLVDAALVRRRGAEPLESLGLPERAVELLRDGSVTTVATAGRLSPEKNHARLLRALARARDEGCAVAAVVMGSGPLVDDLAALVDELDLGDLVVLTGHVPNPLPVVAAADCFVLSSDHEGQPMVLLEAYVLGTPVVTTAFSSVAGAVPPGHGVVVPRDEEALARAMMTVASSRPTPPRFDAEAYNAAALAEFLRAVTDEDPAAAHPAMGAP